MIGILEYVMNMLRILANEVEDTQDGEERIATLACALVRNDRKEGAA